MRIIGQGLGPGLTRVATRRSVIFNVDGLEFVFTLFGDAQPSSSSNAPPATARADALKISRRLKPVLLRMISPSEREMDIQEAASSFEAVELYLCSRSRRSGSAEAHIQFSRSS